MSKCYSVSALSLLAAGSIQLLTAPLLYAATDGQVEQIQSGEYQHYALDKQNHLFIGADGYYYSEAYDDEFVVGVEPIYVGLFNASAV